MPKLILAIAFLLSPLTAMAEESPDEATKIRALILGYVLNGNSMVRPLGQGSIDVSDLIKPGRLNDQEAEPAPPKRRSKENQ